MIFIPGILISAVTFPGVAVHELSHQICCRICRIPVYEVKYFQLQNPCGYVLHEPTSNPWKNLLTGLGPFFINTFIGMIITFPAYFCLWGGGKYMYGYGSGNTAMTAILMVLYWLGLSILMHAFPSTGDAKSLVESVMKNNQVNIVAKIVTAPFIGLIYLGAIGSAFWLDLLYGIGMSMVLPMLAEKLMYL
ncbi:MAG: DUF3267 domain-containing protein [Suilimivivens sp.]